MVLSRYPALAAFLYAYTWIMSLVGGMPGLTFVPRYEVPLLLFVYYCLNQFIRPSKWQALIAAIPIVFVYVVFDMVFMQFGRLFRIIEIKELPELMAVLPAWANVLLIALLGGLLILFLRSLRFKLGRLVILGLLPTLGIILSAGFAPDHFLAGFDTFQRSVTLWSDIQSAEDNGRVWMMLYNEAKRRSNTKKMLNFKADPDFLKKMDETVAMVDALKKKRNVHLVVLESFVDPNLFEGLTFSKKPTHPDFEKIFKNKGSLSIAPLFAGGTAQSEFEVLAGVPAFGKFSGMEFDVFTGAGTYCLPALLARAGYHTMATNAYKPDFFNSINAYRGVGFQKSYYPREYAKGRETYLSTGDVTGEKYMFDGVLLQQNLDFVSQWMKDNPGVPLFNYIMSIYGHYPYGVNTEKRPLLIETKGVIKDGHLEHSVNQFYYRTQALAEFLNRIREIDPQSLVILISDHLPGLNGPSTFEKLKYAGGDEKQLYLNRAFFLRNGKAVRYDTLRHYYIPDIILNYLTDGSYCKNQECKFKAPENHDEAEDYYDDAYLAIIDNAMK